MLKYHNNIYNDISEYNNILQNILCIIIDNTSYVEIPLLHCLKHWHNGKNNFKMKHSNCVFISFLNRI